MAVSNAMQAYAVSIGNQTLFYQMSTSFSSMMYAKNEDAISRAQLVLDKTKSIPVATLTPFGITDPVIDALTAIIATFTSVAPSTRNVVTNKTVLTNNLKQLVKEGSDIMRKTLLKLGRQFMATDPDFYEGMVANAMVINRNIHAKLRLTVKDAETAQPLTGVLIEISGTALQGMTDMSGKCTITNVTEGTYNVVLRKTSYEVYTIENAEFKRGKSFSATVDMEPTVVEPVSEVPPVPVVNDDTEEEA
ncbi:MAG: carboxypeptidase regulatory-like domain-containing protein [Bacteroidia bacterium]|nr:carboxypeptidase regulatory-like domain-containing protein [Bacteroidia bacterium]